MRTLKELEVVPIIGTAHIGDNLCFCWFFIVQLL